MSSYAIDDGARLLLFDPLSVPSEFLKLAAAGGVTREQVVERLRPLLALPVMVVLPAHGAPADRAALEDARS